MTGASDIRIRRAKPSEAEFLTELALRSKAYWGYDAAFMARCRVALTVDPEEMRRQPYYVAERDGAILGFYGFEPEGDAVGLSRFFVEPDEIGSGVGRALMEHAKESARRAGHRTLIAVADPNAASFYERLGGQPAGSAPSEIDPARPLPILRFDLA
jgi:N-acetylglutamate synthase-like GNAT family acetyltransferase